MIGKKKVMQRQVRLWGILIVLLLLATGSVFAGEVKYSGAWGSTVSWSIDTDGVLEISGTGDLPSGKDTNAPWIKYKDEIKSIVINGGITAIGYADFRNCSKAESVTIADTVAKIDIYAFDSCSALTTINSANPLAGVTSIGSYAFYKCSALSSISLPVAESISINAFDGCSKLSSVYMPAVKSIGKEAFSGCSSLRQIDIPESTEVIGTKNTNDTVTDDAIGSGCASLEAINVAAANPNYASVDGILFNKNLKKLISCPPNYQPKDGSGNDTDTLTIPSNVTEIDRRAFYREKNIKTVLFSDGSTLNKIGADAFYYSVLEEIVLPDTVSVIGNSAFCSTNITHFEVPDGVKRIEGSTFSHCRSLKTLRFGNGVEEIGDRACYSSPLTTIEIGKNVKKLGANCLYDSFSGEVIVKCFPRQAPTIPESNEGFIKTSNDGLEIHVPYNSTGYDSWRENYQKHLVYDLDPITGEIGYYASSFDYKFHKTSDQYGAHLKKKMPRLYASLNDSIRYSSELPIPGLIKTAMKDGDASLYSKDYIPQGICMTEDFILVTAYDEKCEHNSVIYCIDYVGEKLVSTITLPFNYHVGGIAFDGRHVWVTGNTFDSYVDTKQPFFVHCIDYQVLKNKSARPTNAIAANEISEELYINNKPSFLECDNGILWVGTYKGRSAENKGTVYGYDILNNGSSCGLNTDVYYIITGIPSSAQGMDISNGKLYLSSSFKGKDAVMKTSFITKYDMSGLQKGVPADFVNRMEKRVEVPKMNEEILVNAATVYIIFESGAEEYMTAAVNTDRILPVDISIWR